MSAEEGVTNLETENANSGIWNQLNIQYFKTNPGIFNILQIIFGITCVALSLWASNGNIGVENWFCYVSMISVGISIFWAILHLFVKFIKKVPIPWWKIVCFIKH